MGAQRKVCCVHSVQDTKGTAHPSGQYRSRARHKNAAAGCVMQGQPHPIEFNTTTSKMVLLTSRRTPCNRLNTSLVAPRLLLHRLRSIVCQHQAGAQPQLQAQQHVIGPTPTGPENKATQRDSVGTVEAGAPAAWAGSRPAINAQSAAARNLHAQPITPPQL